MASRILVLALSAALANLASAATSRSLSSLITEQEEQAPISPVLQAFKVIGTAHDLATPPGAESSLANATDSTCAFCHIPGSTELHDVPPGVEAPTAVAGPDGSRSLGKESFFCLTCHDGAIAMGNFFEELAITPGRNLRGEHPISITYDPSRSRLSPATQVKADGLLLFGPGGDQVECQSCHDPHDNSNGFFLRLSNDRSALCLTCHEK